MSAVDPSPEPMIFLTELASNATAQNLSIILYSGNDDALITHRGTEGMHRFLLVSTPSDHFISDNPSKSRIQ